MAPLAGDGIAADDHPAIDHQAAADPRAEDHAEDDVRALAGAVDRLRKREAVGVVVQAHLAAQQPLEVLLERLAGEPGGVGVLDQTRAAREGPWDADTDRAGADFRHQRSDGLQRRGVIPTRRQHSLAEYLAALVEAQRLDLRAAEINTDSHGPSS